MRMMYVLTIFVFGLSHSLTTIQLSEAYSEKSVPERTEFERDGIHFKKLSELVWMHTSYIHLEKGSVVPSNGLIIVAEHGATLVDTAWNNDQTKVILNWAYETLGRRITSAVFTHAHSDKMGGVQALKNYGVATYAHPLTNALAPDRGLVSAEFDLLVLENGTAKVSGERAANDLTLLSVFYPGPGHSEDNIIVHVKGTNILFGGCLVRPGGATSLGNTSDGSIPHWDSSIENISQRFPKANIVIPSHGVPAGRDLLSLTIELVRKARQAE
ncbi:subclass B1 metallo-beta-lactamase [Paremcibacter congregatus]|uniref:beta-lactamase n=1 Tax=Paremcibacter congregatus TaxID=2043170 RepID=A0A2G4YQ08_9PROT|nr:subclass B1 metallo-beta-lactamase [Paremcibacter congregatus]PHZ84413.1 subclass B1 metallo-beta-lactamase [Paremcibacter congregatus]QDE28631.1 subclass B1 metallo-beta-lactamase [Paremcibacter congregatus]